MSDTWPVLVLVYVYLYGRRNSLIFKSSTILSRSEINKSMLKLKKKNKVWNTTQNKTPFFVYILYENTRNQSRFRQEKLSKLFQHIKIKEEYFNISRRVQMKIFCNEPSSNDVVRGDLSVYVP